MVPLMSALITGFITYVYCFTNKLEIHDDLGNMFSQGYPVSSGRWGLALIEKIFPTASIPWLNGVVSILLLSVAICLIIKMFEIRSPLLQILLAGTLMSFPSQMTTFAYMFTTIQYAAGLLLAVCGAYMLSRRDDRKNCIPAGTLLVFSLSIYQPYIAVTASLLVVWCFRMTLQEEYTGKETLLKGLRYIAVILASLAVYYGILAVVKRLSNTELNSYAENNLNSIGDILKGFLVSYTSYAGYFVKGYYDMVRPGVSRIAHFILLGGILFLAVRHFAKEEARKNGRLWCAVLCLLLLPLAVNCIHMISSLFHNLMTFSFTSFYVMAAVLLQECTQQRSGKAVRACIDLSALSLCAVLIANVYFANAVYLKMYMQTEQAKGFYQTVIASLNQQPDFDENSWIVFFGDRNAIKDYPLINTDNQSGIKEGIIQTYAQNNFILYFLGVNLNINSLREDSIPEGWDEIINWDAVKSMPCYPAYGSIQKMAETNEGSIFFVRLGNSEGE